MIFSPFNFKTIPIIMVKLSKIPSDMELVFFKLQMGIFILEIGSMTIIMVMVFIFIKMDKDIKAS